MRKCFTLFLLACLILLAAGCASTITNLTPSHQPRNASGMYPIEAAWDTRQQSVRAHTIKPYVLVDFESYPMRPTLGISNRWETVVPVPADQKSINYHFKFDYEYNAMGKPEKGSKLSPGYKLDILDK